jgi:23S rRNA pseudouridine1911/1915/1917 synthase
LSSTLQSFHFLIDEEEAEQRLDLFLAAQDDPPLSRSQVRKFLDRGEITVNGTLVKAGYSLKVGDQILWRHRCPSPPSTRPQEIPFEVLFDDDAFAIVDKPAGLVVHPAPGHPDQTLVNGLRDRFERLSTIGGELRPGIVHRLDRDTSGALAIAKTDGAHQHLAAQFRAHTARRVYHCLVFGPGLASTGTFSTRHGRHPSKGMRFTGAEGPRHAITHYEVLEEFDSGARLVSCRLETGRTHQIRMHFSEAGAPILGDRLYGGRATSEVSLIARQALHALRLGVEHPDDDRWIDVEAPYPDDFQTAVDALRRGAPWR